MKRPTGLENESERLTSELRAARSRLEALTARRTRAQACLDALRVAHAATVAVGEPDDEQAGHRRRELRDAEDVLTDFDGAIRGTEARLGELAQAEARLTRKMRASAARGEIETHLALAATLDASWRPVLAGLHEFLESGSDVAALVQPLGTSVALPPSAAVLLWRLGDVLDLQRPAINDRRSQVSLQEFEAERFRAALKTIDTILAD